MESESSAMKPWTGLRFVNNIPALAVKGAVCFSCHQQAPTLSRCSKCKRVWYCSQKCQKQDWTARHKQLCPKLVAANTLNVHRSHEPRTWAEYRRETETGQDYSPRFPTDTPRTTYVPLSTAESWYDYYTKISDKSMVAGLLSPDLKPLADNANMSSALIAATDELCLFLTIIAALEATHLATKPNITLHLVGANAVELGSLMLFEELLHLLPTLQNLHVVFVGPELPRSVSGEDESTPLDCCPECTGLKRTRSLAMTTCAYHDYAAREGYQAPDLAVAFQTGHALEEIASWAPTIRYLAREARHPTVFTTFNEHEMLSELAGLKTLGARFIVEGERNRWRGMRPMLDPLEELESSAYYQHQYWYIVAGLDTSPSP
ncbi:Zinc finger MYND domain-containing 17 [Hyphodiscus hymeniophilus]|uniref:Zinc finger MYND domain-containing 17 n=1 Tax=Hyphodiscus hymeniophilus TaxID=353542 RepID=A0A9P6VIE4_9HELO|nr:Zinc finger MYND domain-containing 17 [Hyphodiscus hymeniophilus]